VEARNINTISNVKTYIRVLDSLQGFILSNDVYKAQWNGYKNYIDNCNCMPIIDSLANYYSQEYQSRSLDKKFLQWLLDQLNDIIKEALASDLPKELNRVISSSLNGIIQSINYYNIDGADGVKRAVQALIAELLILESNSNRANPISAHKTFRKASILGSLLLNLLRPSAYDIIGAPADIQSFWIPAIQNLHETAANQYEKFPPLQEILKLSEEYISKTAPNGLQGAAPPKAFLPPAKDP
jgi:hypothetical protein